MDMNLRPAWGSVIVTGPASRSKTAAEPMLQRLQPSLYLGHADRYDLVAHIDESLLSADKRFTLNDAPRDSQAR
jgi:hypothetical protein